MGALAVGLITAGIGAVQSVAQFSAQRQEAKANQENATESWKQQQNQLTKRAMQEEDALRQKQQQQNIEEAQARADVVTSAAAGGISGISLDNLVADVGRRASFNRQAEEENTRNTLSQIRLERKGINSQAQGRINSVPKPSGLSLVAGVGGAALKGYNAYKM